MTDQSDAADAADAADVSLYAERPGYVGNPYPPTAPGPQKWNGPSTPALEAWGHLLSRPPAEPEPEPSWPTPRLDSLLAERPDWDALEVSSVSWGFHTWALNQVPDIIAMSALPDAPGSAERYVIVQSERDAPGRYRVTVCYPDADPDHWLLGPPRHRMDIRAALGLMARMVTGEAG